MQFKHRYRREYRNQPNNMLLFTRFAQSLNFHLNGMTRRQFRHACGKE